MFVARWAFARGPFFEEKCRLCRFLVCNRSFDSYNDQLLLRDLPGHGTCNGHFILEIAVAWAGKRTKSGSPMRIFAWFITSVVLLLYLAAILKFATFFSSAVDAAYVPLSLRLLGVGFDLTVAALILRNRDLQSSLKLIFLSFTILGFSSVYLYSDGYASCGCAGIISLDPLYVSVFDFFIVAVSGTMIVSCRSFVRRHAIRIENSGKRFSAALNSFSLGAGLSYMLIGLFYVVMPYIAPGPLEISANINFGSRRLGDGIFEVVFPIRNKGGVDIQIVGMSSTCRCMGVITERKEIPPSGQDSLVVRVYPQRTGRFAQQLFVYTDHPRQLRIPVLFRGSFSGEGSK